MKAKERVFVNHIVTTVRKRLHSKGDIIEQIEYEEKEFQEILLYISLVKLKAQKYNIEIVEDVIPNALLVFSIIPNKNKSHTVTGKQVISNVLAAVK